MRCRKEITFFYSNPVESQTATPVAAEAEKRGYRTRLTDKPFEQAEIGVYCAHDNFPRHAKLSIVMLHDMGQGQLNWPNMWRFEPWNDFDVGILPGEVWEQRWQESCSHRYSRPREGVYTLGWPKSDSIFSAGEACTSTAAAALRDSLGLRHEISVLYAPAWENDGKQDEFVRALMDLPVNLLLKQYPWTDEWPDMLANVAAANALHRDIAPNVHILDPSVNIMHAIEIGDVMVSEESSCLIEALLKGRPAISVSDWMVPDTQPPRLPAAPFDFLIRTPKAGLRDVVSDIIADLPRYRAVAIAERERNFSYLGDSARHIVDLIDALVEEREPPHPGVTALHAPGAASAQDIYRKYLRKAVYTLKYRLGIKQPLKKLAHDFLVRS